MITIPNTKEMATIMDQLQIEMDCFCEVKKNALMVPEWSLTEKAENLLRKIFVLKSIPGDITISKLATKIADSDYVFGGA